jgi:hemoglobin-like flavoprotein
MTPRQLELVRSSYAALGDDAAAMAADFYGRLFAADPTARDLFTQDTDVMSEKFSAELAAIVEAITSYPTFATRVHDLAERHVEYGVRTEHFRAVGDALLASLAIHLDGMWDDELDAAWRRAYNLVAEMMMATAAGDDTQA